MDLVPSIGQPPAENGSRRVEKLNRLLQQEVASLLAREIEWPREYMVTVTKVKVARDAESAKVWVSVMPAEYQDEVLSTLSHRIGDLQHLLNKRLVMKFVPKITFLLDEQPVRTEQVTKLLDSLAEETPDPNAPQGTGQKPV
ncbi:MAG: 30S ribosome-binding factor RbfA [Candidatus Kerfeldbacteria bacterium]|nr:30S ribosome-binding factor RbfA [Candidatus Kerfeldbacteria bacterium]